MYYKIQIVMIKLLKILRIALMLSANAFAGSDGELEISKKSQSTKDCF